jgi:hypothetical protein
MYLNKKNIKNSDILCDFLLCPFGETLPDCPFILYHNLKDPDKQIEALDQLSDQEIQKLRDYTNNCIKILQNKNHNLSVNELVKSLKSL